MIAKNKINIDENFDAIDINDLRIKIDQLNEKIISGLKTRSRFSLNKKTYSEKFSNNLSWIMYRLKKEQNLDSEFGRFLYYDQQPFVFSKNELNKSKIGGVKNKGVAPIKIDLSKPIITLYKNTITDLCENKEEPETYGETTKIDVENMLTLNERTVALGEQVAAYKITTEPSLLKLKTKKEICNNLIKPEREKEVITKMNLIAKKYGVGNEKIISNFSKELIKITLNSEVNFILTRIKQRK
jgi:chorismate mutase